MAKVPQASGRLPAGTLLAYYGDDLTGSTAVMEVLTSADVPTILFLETPGTQQLGGFPGYRAVGIAGMARSKSPQWMDMHLPAVFRNLKEFDAPIVHYKVCSTLDSSPHVGSIGHAIDLAAAAFGGDWYPLLVAAPALGRYQAFGNLFAAAGEETYRIDRHPIMARHPITPMDEADTRRHLARQTAKRLGLVDYVSMKQGTAQARLQSERAKGAAIISLDVVDDDTLSAAGRLIWENRGEHLFVIGSQGIEYALIAHWRSAGLLPPAASTGEVFPLTPAERIACVCGSCSSLTASQIDDAAQNGFAPIWIDAALAVADATWQSEVHRVVGLGLQAIEAGQDPLIFTARHPEDLVRVTEAIRAAGCATERVQARIGEGLGQTLATLVERTGIRRVAVAGGDTSGHVAKALGIAALSMLAPLAPGAPLCQAHGSDGRPTGLEIAFKGGQMGQKNYFSTVRGCL